MPSHAAAPAPPATKVDRFRPIEKYYRHRGDGHKNAKQRRRERHLYITNGGVVSSEVLDVHDLGSNSVTHRARVRNIPLVPSGDPFTGTILDARHAALFEIDGHPGLRILINAMPLPTQVEWALRALREYSQNPFTNLSNLTKDRLATTNLWKDVWESPGEETWKSFQSLRWANVGRHYDWTEREYLDTPDMPPLPPELKQLVQEVFEITGMQDSCKVGESGIVNFYPAGTMMGGHMDNAEEDMVNPIVSLSLGTQCIYLQGGVTRETVPTPLWLRSARRCFHGVPLVTSKLSSEFIQAMNDFSALVSSAVDSRELHALRVYMARARININLRRVRND
ncbi:alkylated DNA repair protein AlkB, variant [Aphanomyces invadans]|uniref:Alkylated DNA repair protein AlkB, variant n=1 Tax=Aphanomyces invadans TaxID=157072 RepID=A0A024UQ63_9STRA|nr:alkylated DNA repair protein AlkB, variant [Aphanomyces invadans]ETW08399.1 alkylated DNA repair protein AlkB, variant [Aphanomyces invadans]|eukprot:XP_008862204.1 alkylated DNA repair protein AlkB, variant [Aphanomyces invadans]